MSSSPESTPKDGLRKSSLRRARAAEFGLEGYDYIIDAIDSLKDKALLIQLACDTEATFFSSMGAARKMDPTRIRVAEFWKVEGDPLARTLRKRFKQQESWPSRKFKCVYSDELLQNKVPDSGQPQEPRANGTIAHITAIFGFMLVALVLRHAVRAE